MVIRNTLSLLVCSNRRNILFANIWNKVKSDKKLLKIILVTQKQANLYQNNDPKVAHIKLDGIGRSNAINVGLQKINAEFVGLTDDDCFLDKSWVSQAKKALSNPSIDLVYGQTKQYQPEKNKNKTCPCTFTKNPNKNTVTVRLCKHWIDVGFDNNAAIKKKVFEKIGGYKWWLGPGSIGVAAEDAEFILRALIARYKIAYNPSMVVYHNKWLNEREQERQSRIYLHGGIAAYGFYYFQGVKECHPIISSDISQFFHSIFDEIQSFIKKPYSPIILIKSVFLDLYYLCRGLLIAFIFAKIIPIPEQENVVKKYYKKIKNI